MIITTAGRSTSELASKAKKLSISFGLPYIERNGVSIEALKEQYQNDIVVVLKDHWKSERFAQLGFTQHKRKTSLFHYGTIELR